MTIKYTDTENVMEDDWRLGMKRSMKKSWSERRSGEDRIEGSKNMREKDR